MKRKPHAVIVQQQTGALPALAYYTPIALFGSFQCSDYHFITPMY
jgi:hypothetical protein